jgi:hypothetical protein
MPEVRLAPFTLPYAAMSSDSMPSSQTGNPGSSSPLLVDDESQGSPRKDFECVPLIFRGAKSELEATKDSICNQSDCTADVKQFKANESRQVHRTSKSSQRI